MNTRPSFILGAALLSVVLASGCREASAAIVISGSSAGVAADDPVSFGRVPDFALTSQRGATVTLSTLEGRPFVMAVVYTTCSGPCPRISRNMRLIQEALRETDARLVTLSVDPERDTPEVLRGYARDYGADPERWLFLTGDRREIEALVRGGFWMAVDRDGDDITHSTKLLVVDAKGERREWYDGEEGDCVEQVVARVKFLEREGRGER